jgi:hypothetical protein
MMATIYGTTETGAAVDRQVEYDVADESITIKNAPEKWSYEYQHKGTKKSTFQSEAEAWAYEHLLRLGGNMPVWTGVITKQLHMLLMWGGVQPPNMTRTIKRIRHVLAAHAKVVWKNRCETVYSPENEAKRIHCTQEKLATRVIQETGAAGYTTAMEVMRMTPKQTAQLRQNKIGGWQESGAQRKITQLFQPAVITNQMRTQKLPATIELQKHKTQRTITTQGEVGPVAEMEPRTTKEGNKKARPDNSQPTLQEVWGFEEDLKRKNLASPVIGKKEKQRVIHPRTKGNEASKVISALNGP